MTKRWINIVFFVLGGHGLVLILLMLNHSRVLYQIALLISLLISILILCLKMYARVTSPYALATMYVAGLKKNKFSPPLSGVEEPEANQLMKALNLLSEDIQNKQEVIKKLENLRIEFVANVSHELKTPLTSIRGYTETLVNGAYKDSETCLKFLKRIEENSEKLSALISDLLDLSRLETFPNDLNWQKFPSQNITEKLEGIFFPVLSRTEHKMYLKFQDPVIEGDRKKLEQVFLNLIDNAIRYTPSGTLIELVQSSDQNDWIYKVKDNGPGIPQEHLPRIFERFYTIDQARTKDKGGTGLGLAIVKHIILAHGGSIEAESPPGQGTQFIFKIPKKESFNIKKS